MDLREIAKQELDEINRRKYKARRIIRFIFLGFILVLMCYSLCYTAIDIYYFVDTKINKRNENFINLCDKSYLQSKKIYDRLIVNEGDYVINDFAFFAERLTLSPYKINNQLNMPPISLENVCHSKNRIVIDTDFIDLNQLEVGDYFFHFSLEEKDYYYRANQVINETILLLPDNNGKRKEVSLKALPANKALVLSVRSGRINEQTVDIVINHHGNPYFIGENGLDEKLKILNPYFRIKVVGAQEETIDQQLLNIKMINPLWAFSFQESENEQLEIATSRFSKIFTDQQYLQTLSDQPLIKQLGGKVTGAINCDSEESSCALINYQNKNSFGIDSFVIKTKEKDLFPDFFDYLLKMLFVKEEKNI